MDKFLSFFRLLQLFEIECTGLKLLRHSNAELPILAAFRGERAKFEAYQGFQKPNKFRGTTQVAAFVADAGTTARFLGLWRVCGEQRRGAMDAERHAAIVAYGFPETWHEERQWYELQPDPRLGELSERLLIEWGSGTRSWVQTQDKVVVEIRAAHSIGDFVSYDAVQLRPDELRRLIANPSANRTWVSALSAVNAVYLIRDCGDGRLYVGSAYGENGLYGRWQNYAQNGHGDNRELKDRDGEKFEYSILEILPPTLSPREVCLREERWKERLGTRTFGLNRN